MIRKLKKFKIKKRLKKQKGSFTTEALVAATIVTLSMMVMAPMFGWSVKASNLNKEKSSAVQIAQTIIEQVQNKGFNNASGIVSSTNTQSVETDDLEGKKYYLAPDGEIFHQNEPTEALKLLQIQRIYAFVNGDPNTLADDLIQVTIKITWPGASTANITMSTALPREGL